MADDPNGRERRHAQRYGCAGDAEIVVPGNGLRFAGRVVNLSASGCFVETDCRLERGTSVEVWMNAEGLPLRVSANLIVRRPGGVGLRFHNVSPRRLEQIRHLIRELSQACEAPSPEQQPAASVGQAPALCRDPAYVPAASTHSAPPQRNHLSRIFGKLRSLCTGSGRLFFRRKTVR